MFVIPPRLPGVPSAMVASTRRTPSRPATVALRMAALCAVAVLAALGGPVTASADVLPGIFAPRSAPLGHSYGAWTAAWWQQAYLVHATPSSPFGSGAVDCRSLGAGGAIFLAGTAGGSASRSCQVPAGRPVLIPLVNAECSLAIDNQTTYVGRVGCARDLIDHVDASSLLLAIGIHGHGPQVRVPPQMLARFRFDSPPFAWSSVADNPFGVPVEANNPSAANGYFVMLRPMWPGRYDLSFGGSAPSLPFATRADYDLTVV